MEQESQESDVEITADPQEIARLVSKAASRMDRATRERRWADLLANQAAQSMFIEQLGVTYLIKPRTTEGANISVDDIITVHNASEFEATELLTLDDKGATFINRHTREILLIPDFAFDIEPLIKEPKPVEEPKEDPSS